MSYSQLEYEIANLANNFETTERHLNAELRRIHDKLTSTNHQLYIAGSVRETTTQDQLAALRQDITDLRDGLAKVIEKVAMLTEQLMELHNV